LYEEFIRRAWDEYDPIREFNKRASQRTEKQFFPIMTMRGDVKYKLRCMTIAVIDGVRKEVPVYVQWENQP
jgi:hypothetical protein